MKNRESFGQWTLGIFVCGIAFVAACAVAYATWFKCDHCYMPATEFQGAGFNRSYRACTKHVHLLPMTPSDYAKRIHSPSTR